MGHTVLEPGQNDADLAPLVLPANPVQDLRYGDGGATVRPGVPRDRNLGANPAVVYGLVPPIR